MASRYLIVAAAAAAALAAFSAAAAQDVCTPAAIRFAQAGATVSAADRILAGANDPLAPAQALLSARQFEAAERSLLALSQPGASPRTRAHALQLLGVARLMLGDATLAKRSLEDAIEASAVAGMAETASQARYNLGLLALGFAEAGEASPRSIALFGQSPAKAALGNFDAAVQNASAELLPKIQLGAVRALLAGENAAEAQRRFQGLAKNPASDLERLAIADLGRRIVSASSDEKIKSKVSATISTLLEPVRISRERRIQSYAEGTLASVAFEMGNLSAALQLAQKALRHAEHDAAEDLRLRWLALIGQIHLASNTPEAKSAALIAFEAARQSVERVRANLPQFDPVSGRSLFREVVDPIYMSLAELQIDRGQRVEGQSANSARGSLRQARNTIEVLKQVEAEQFFQDECVAAALGQRVALERVLEQEPTTAIVYPILIARENKERLIILVSRTDAATGDETIRKTEVPVAPGEIHAAARAFRAALGSNSRDISPIRKHGALLFERLIRPIESDLTGADTIVFVPDGVLRSVPWPALYDASTQSYLVDRFATANSISLELTSPKPIADVARRVLVAGVSQAVLDPETGQELGEALPNVEREVKFLSNKFGGDAKSLGSALTRASLSQALARDNYTIVHLATHAKFGGAPRENFILGADGRITFDELSSYIRPTRLNGKPIELLALSACETAQGDDRATLGLAGVAIHAGARSVVGSLWRISDSATPIFYEAFYRALDDPSQSKAKAVQRAQKALLHGKRAQFTHPAHWAPFVLIGNWQ